MRAGWGEAIQGQTTRRSYPPPRGFLNSRGHGGGRGGRRLPWRPHRCPSSKGTPREESTALRRDSFFLPHCFFSHSKW